MRVKRLGVRVRVYFHSSAEECFSDGLSPKEVVQITKAFVNSYPPRDFRITNIQDHCGHVQFETIWQQTGVPPEWEINPYSFSFWADIAHRVSPYGYYPQTVPCKLGGVSLADLEEILIQIEQLPNRTQDYVVEIESTYKNTIAVYMGKQCYEPARGKSNTGSTYSFRKNQCSGYWKDPMMDITLIFSRTIDLIIFERF